MSKGHFIRCDHWRLQGNPDLVAAANDTIREYRLLTNALCSAVLTHWPSLAGSATPIQDLERLIHPTKENPSTVYGRWFQARFARFPSYLRRAAEQAALGAVSSFMTRYRTWQSGNRSRRDARPPAWGGFQGYPVPYSAKGGAGAMVKYLGVERGVNVTLGLPLVRTSPDHGTAFDLAGTGRADAGSLLAAVRMARQLSK